MTWLLDLDGAVWLSGQAIPGAAEAIERLRRHGEHVVYFTHNSGPLVTVPVSSYASERRILCTAS